MPPKIENSKITDDRQIATANGWAIAGDGTQWILQRWRGKRWVNLSFVRSTKDVLAQCMNENGTPADTAKLLLAAVGDTFDAPHEGRERPRDTCSSDYLVPGTLGCAAVLILSNNERTSRAQIFYFHFFGNCVRDEMLASLPVGPMQRIRPA